VRIKGVGVLNTSVNLESKIFEDIISSGTGSSRFFALLTGHVTHVTV